jgi:hypothetical protein
MLSKTKAEVAHVEYMAPLLRSADKKEIEAYSGMTPYEGLYYSMSSSPICYSLMEDGNPVAMYGGVPNGNGTASVWMLATDQLANCSKQFLRNTRTHMDLLHEELDSSLLYALADPRNTAHQLWLVYSGFKLGKFYRVNNHNFISVTRLKCVSQHSLLF